MSTAVASHQVDHLGLPRVINASATLTRLGGSIMPVPVREAMTEAAASFVELPELQRRASARIAQLTHNEAVYICSGAAAGLVLTAAACIAGADPAATFLFPQLEGVDRREVVIHRSQRNGYDYAIRQTGATLVEVGETEQDLRDALSARTACVVWFAGMHYADGALPLERVIAIAHDSAWDVPVIVDAAAQVPPVASLWHFTRDLGADAAVFSGGKGLRGPQSSGLIIGRQEIIDACRIHGNPNHGFGRPMKVGKEEIAGIVAAVEWSLAQDENAILAGYEATVQMWIAGLSDLPGVEVHRGYPSEAGQPHGRAIVRITPDAKLTRDEVVAALWETNPRIAVSTSGMSDEEIALNPQTLEPDEDAIVLDTLRQILSAG